MYESQTFRMTKPSAPLRGRIPSPTLWTRRPVDGERVVLEHEARIVRTVHRGPRGIDAVRTDDAAAGPEAARCRDRAEVHRIRIRRARVHRVWLRAGDERGVPGVDDQPRQQRPRVVRVAGRPLEDDRLLCAGDAGHAEQDGQEPPRTHGSRTRSFATSSAVTT